MIHKAEQKIFEILAKHGASIPVIIVGTMKDKFLNFWQSELTNDTEMREPGKRLDIIVRESEEEAKQRLLQKQDEFPSEVEQIDGLKAKGIQYAFVAKSKNRTPR